MDKDGDGFIAEREWVPVIKMLMEFECSKFKCNGPRNTMYHEPGSRDMRLHFPLLDKNEDDRISRREFESLLKGTRFLLYAEEYLYCDALPSDFCETVNSTADAPTAISDTQSATIATTPKTSASGNKAKLLSLVTLFTMSMIAHQ